MEKIGRIDLSNTRLVAQKVKDCLFLGDNWNVIAKKLGVSNSTLWRWRKENEETLRNQSVLRYTEISDEALDDIVRSFMHEHPNRGEKIIKGRLGSRGIRVQRQRLRDSMRRVDPVGMQERYVGVYL